MTEICDQVSNQFISFQWETRCLLSNSVGVRSAMCCVQITGWCWIMTERVRQQPCDRSVIMCIYYGTDRSSRQHSTSRQTLTLPVPTASIDPCCRSRRRAVVYTSMIDPEKLYGMMLFVGELVAIQCKRKTGKNVRCVVVASSMAAAAAVWHYPLNYLPNSAMI